MPLLFQNPMFCRIYAPFPRFLVKTGKWVSAIAILYISIYGFSFFILSAFIPNFAKLHKIYIIIIKNTEF